MLLIIERMAHLKSGHEHTQLAAIREMIPHAEVRLLSAVANDGSDPGAILSTRRAARKKPEASLDFDVAAITRHLLRLNRDRACVVIPNANAFEIRFALRLLETQEGRVFCCLRVLRPEAVSLLPRTTLARLRQAILAGALSLHTETVELKYYLQEHYDLSAEDDFLLPCSIDPRRVPPARDSQTQSSFRVGFLGAPRREKGAHEIPGILKALAQTIDSVGRPVVFTLQKPKFSRLRLSPAHYMISCNLAVRRAKNLSIDWQEGGLPEAGFCKVIESQDMLLLPYRLDAYRYRGSGMVVDGVLAGLPILCTKGIAMKHLLSSTGTEAASPEEFARGILDLLNARPFAEKKISAARTLLQTELDRTRALFSRLVALDGNKGERAKGGGHAAAFW